MAITRSSLRRFGRAEPTPAVAAGPGFAETFAASPVAMLVLDPVGNVAHANSAAELLLNQSERSMRGHPLINALELPEGYEPRGDGRGFAAIDADMTLARGGRIRADFLETTVVDHPGWRIVTIHHAANARRIGPSTDRTAGARAAIGAAAMLAHEIKNPLSGIRGAAQLLAGITDDDESRDELTRLITTEVDRIAALIDRMQDFTDTRPPTLKPANIYPLLAHARSVALAGFARDIPIEERFDPSLPPVLLDDDAFLQVMLNLLKNAAEAVALVASPRIILSTAYRPGMSINTGPGTPRMPLPIEILVTDNGPGPPADIAEHLFEPFVSSKREGKGLGLPLVDKLVGQMGGIAQYAREGDPELTVFRLLLPRAREL